METEALGPVIHHLINGYEDYIDIIERPDMGLFEVPVEICTLIHNVLSHSLFSFMMRKSSNVSVKCTTTPTTLILEVVADSAYPPQHEVRESILLGNLNQHASNLDGEIVTGGEMFSDDRPSLNVFYKLIVPIPS